MIIIRNIALLFLAIGLTACAGRPVFGSLIKAVCCFPDIEHWYFMRNIKHLQIWRNAIGHTFH